ncbi:DUF2560 family protein [Klebsiella pneumoniae]|uniref:DUF2560 family protein n=1 Tax=Klebsiella pneumoniae TaxID=573 RepID=UPI00350E92C6
MTPAEQIRLNLLSTLNYDTAAAAKAIEFVQDSPLKYQLFIQQYNRVTTESEVVAHTECRGMGISPGIDLIAF